MLEEPLYAQLRTKEQLGYTVSCGSKWTDGVVGFAISVTSDDSHPDHVAGRVAAFLKAHRKVVMSPDFIEEFVDQCCSLADRGNEKPRSPSDLADRHWDAIVDRCPDLFDADAVDALLAAELTPAALRATYDRVFGLGSCAGDGACGKLVVRVVGRAASFADGRGPAGGSDAFGVVVAAAGESALSPPPDAAADRAADVSAKLAGEFWPERGSGEWGGALRF